MARIKRVYHSGIPDASLIDLVESFNKILQEHLNAYVEQEHDCSMSVYYTEEMSEQEEAIEDLKNKLATLEQEKYRLEHGDNIVKGQQTILSLNAPIPRDVLDMVDRADPNGDYWLYSCGRKLVKHFKESDKSFKVRLKAGVKPIDKEIKAVKKQLGFLESQLKENNIE